MEDEERFSEDEDPIRINLSDLWDQAKKDRYVLSHVESLIGRVRGALEDNSALLNRLTRRFLESKDKLNQENQELRERVEKLESASQEDAAVIGQMKGDLVAMSETIEAMRQWAKKIDGSK